MKNERLVNVSTAEAPNPKAASLDNGSMFAFLKPLLLKLPFPFFNLFLFTNTSYPSSSSFVTNLGCLRIIGGSLGGTVGGTLGGTDGGMLGGTLGGTDGGMLGGTLGGMEGGMLGGADGGTLGGTLGGTDGGMLGGAEGG
ncbi:unnamed protein product, partial [marine sediment metagenome]